MTSIIDTNLITTPQITHLLADKIETVIRYLSSINPRGAKCVQPAEARALAAAGIRLGLVCEGWGDFGTHGEDFPQISGQAGIRDGRFCVQYAPTVGAPAGACVFFAVDTDASSSQIMRFVLPYFQAIANAFKGSGLLVGVYGSGAVCEACVKAGLVTYTWLSQSMGWTNSRAYLAAKPKELVLVQGAVTRLANLDTDQDTSENESAGSFGDFLPFAPIPAAPTAAPPTPSPSPPPASGLVAEAETWIEDEI